MIPLKIDHILRKNFKIRLQVHRELSILQCTLCTLQLDRLLLIEIEEKTKSFPLFTTFDIDTWRSVAELHGIKFLILDPWLTWLEQLRLSSSSAPGSCCLLNLDYGRVRADTKHRNIQEELKIKHTTKNMFIIFYIRFFWTQVSREKYEEQDGNIGQGGFGSVKLLQNRETKELVAGKFVKTNTKQKRQKLLVGLSCKVSLN